MERFSRYYPDGLSHSLLSLSLSLSLSVCLCLSQLQQSPDSRVGRAVLTRYGSVEIVSKRKEKKRKEGEGERDAFLIPEPSDRNYKDLRCGTSHNFQGP
ncbi:hypothetical protein GGS21DRAFT_511848 [Xylaria nigripes]|nr:hypothetical protein GGS21DRAFT_511848 [Xylaria nigripes]